eukprot:g23666.t1
MCHLLASLDKNHQRIVLRYDEQMMSSMPPTFRIERPRRTAAVKTAAKSQVKPGLKHCLSKPETKKVEPSRPPQDAVQRVLEEASRLAKEVADVQRQFRQSQLAVDARGSEATAFLDDIAQAGAKRSRVA